MRHLTLKPEHLTTRDTDDGTLTMEGLAVPWGQSIDYAGITEQFARGSIDPDSAIGRPLLWSHERSEPIGHITDARDTPEGLAVTAVVQPTSRGRDAITLLRSQSLRGLSVGFEPTEMKNTPTGVTYTRAILHELSTTPLPAYPSAAVTATRAEEAPVTEQTTETREAPVDLAPITERIDQLEARMIDQRPAPEPVRIHPREAFTRLVREYGEDRSKISQRADMVSSGNSGLTSTERTSREIIEYFDAERYFTSRVASIPFPESGIVHTLPIKTQRSQVGKAAEKAPAPSRAITTATAQFTGEFYKGYLDISYELIRTSSPGAVSVAVDDMLGEAAVQSETLFVAAVEAAATVGGTALDFTDYGAFVLSVRSAVRAVRAAAGKGLLKVAVTSDNFDKLLGFTDADGRRVFATTGATNADGAASLVAEEVSIPGITFFESPHSTVDVAFNDNALKRSELPPLTLSADNVPLIGRDVGILGNIMAVPRIPAGVVKLAAA